MARQTLFTVESAVAVRQPKTDTLIVPRFLKEMADDKRLKRSGNEGRPRRAREMGRTGIFRAAWRN